MTNRKGPSVALLRFGIHAMTARSLPTIALLAAAFTLSPEEYGRLAVAVTGFAIATVVGDSGLDAAATKLGANNLGLVRTELFSSLIVSRMFLAILVSVPIGWLTLLTAFSPSRGTIVVGAVESLALLSAAAAAAARIRERLTSSGEVAMLTLEKSISSVGFVVCLPFVHTAIALTACFFASSAVGSAVAIVRFGLGDVSDWRQNFVPLWAAAVGFTLSVVAANVTWRAGVMYLGFVGNHSAAGALNLAILPVQAATMIFAGAAPLILTRPVSAVTAAGSDFIRAAWLATGASIGYVIALIAVVNFGPSSTAASSTFFWHSGLLLLPCITLVGMNSYMAMWVRLSGASRVVPTLSILSIGVVLPVTAYASKSPQWAPAAILLAEVATAALLFAFFRRLQRREKSRNFK